MITLEIETGTDARQVDLLSYLDGPARERSHEQEYAWIKALRHLPVDGVPLRRRFQMRGDSLWWFAELYLHKRQAILGVFRTLAAFEQMIARERPRAVRLVAGGDPHVVAQAAARGLVRFSASVTRPPERWTLLKMDARARGLAAAARLSRLRNGAESAHLAAPVPVAAFVHRAFWRWSQAGGDAESYIGPVLDALEHAVPGGLRYIGVGPASNFRARRWWRPGPATPGEVVPIERLAPAWTLREAQQMFRERHLIREALWHSDAIRAHAVIDGCDCWPLIREELAGIALLQFPWSARAMDEAAAALDVLKPRVALTYAEAGGWGRALALESRRRGIPLAGLQHGFIYRHWLNYRHEADEIPADPGNPADAGFPRPALTLLFDEHARRHLETDGRFPKSALTVTGSARRDELIRDVAASDAHAIALAREAAGAGNRALVVFAGKEREARSVLPGLVEAIVTLPDVQLAIKPHPAETPEVYAAFANGHEQVRVLPSATPLAPLLAGARLLVTVNSTVAIDALALALPSLVLGLPNNLSPFVAGGMMSGVHSHGPEEIRAEIVKLLYNQEFRTSLVQRAGIPARDGRSAARTADAVLRLGGITPSRASE